MTRVMSLAPARLLRMAGLWAILTVVSASAAWAYWEGECEGYETECWEEEATVECAKSVIGVREDGSTERLYLVHSREVTETESSETTITTKLETGACALRVACATIGTETKITESTSSSTTYGIYMTQSGYMVEIDCYDLSIERQGQSLA